MEALLEAVAAIVDLVSPEKILAISNRIRKTSSSEATKQLAGVVGTPTASKIINELIEAWRNSIVSSDELASMLLAACYVQKKSAAKQFSELVWTGPTTPAIATRRTEQALLQVINSARSTLFITSFVAYDVSSIVKALNAATERGVTVTMLLESSQNHGGSISMDVIGKMRSLVAEVRLFAWMEKDHEFSDGRVHAKVAVADGRICFITSANLTSYAMEKNMEAGVLISGGSIPHSLELHLQALVELKLITPV